MEKEERMETRRRGKEMSDREGGERKTQRMKEETSKIKKR